MKRLILTAVLGAAAMWLSAPTAQAWGCKSCGHCGAEFCVRQYNAFSPVCHGTIYCDGINPICGVPGGLNPYCCGCAAPGSWLNAGVMPPEGPPAATVPAPLPSLPGPATPVLPSPTTPTVLPPGAVPQFLPPPGAQGLPMPTPGPIPYSMGYPYHMPWMNPNVMPAGYPYGYPGAYGYPPGYGYQQPMMPYPPQNYYPPQQQ